MYSSLSHPVRKFLIPCVCVSANQIYVGHNDRIQQLILCYWSHRNCAGCSERIIAKKKLSKTNEEQNSLIAD